MNTSLTRTQTDYPHPGARPLIGITMGDPAGIGAEIIVKALSDPSIRELGRFVVFGIDEVLMAAADDAGIRPFWFTVDARQAMRIDSGVLVANFTEYAAGYWTIARPTELGGKASLSFLDRAVETVKLGVVDAICTGPIHKTSWALAGCRYPGHTEKLADAFNTKRVTMAFVGGGLRVALASTHVGLFDLRNQFTIGMVFQPIDQLHEALTKWFGITHPRIAVAGLNPHAGEDGRFGDEERRVIEPAMQMARGAGIDVEGPFSADTMFLEHRRARYDGFVCMYHDQGLIPVKLLAFDRAVNVSLGLPVVRTSVDHGTAFDIAGTNQADPGSMKEAIRLACHLASLSSPVLPVESPLPDMVL